MTDSQVQQAYAARAAEYTAILGAIDDMHELDRSHIERWAEQISGRIIDAGCGPGHWTDFLHRRGADISGIDLVPEFIESARLRFPDVSFQVSTLRGLDAADGSLNGVLAWYSLIHLPRQNYRQFSSSSREFSRHKGACSSAFSRVNPQNRLTTRLPRLTAGPLIR